MMKLKRGRMNKIGENGFLQRKKAVSEMISYVILIAIGIGLSIGVYVWLKDITNVNPAIDCKEGTSLILNENPQTSAGQPITINVKNNGLFNISGLIMHVGNDTKKDPIKRLSAIGGRPSKGYYDFNPPLKPGENRTVVFLNEPDYNITIVQIQPYIINEKNNTIVCEKSLIKQEIVNIESVFDPLSISSLVSWWKLDINELDSGPNSQSGIPMSGGGIFEDNALKLNGSNGYVAVAGDPVFDMTNKITISAWIKNVGNNTHGWNPSGRWDDIVTKWDCTDDCNVSCWWFGINPQGKIEFVVINSSGSQSGISATGTSVIRDDSAWHHVVGVYNGTYLKVYLNGSLEDETAYSQDIHINSSIPIRIGASGHTEPNAFNGSIKNVMIFSDSLSEDIIKNI